MLLNSRTSLSGKISRFFIRFNHSNYSNDHDRVLLVLAYQFEGLAS